eukprot:126423-Amphidinium_carterae.1
MEGSIPPRLLGFSSFGLEFAFVALEVSHEGTIPVCARRLSSPWSRVALGRGLRGPLPRISGTVELLSLFGNTLEGHLPELRLSAEQSSLFFHDNDFSCNLPLNGKVKLNVSLALIGNHFTQPRQIPAWITSLEQPSG